MGNKDYNKTYKPFILWIIGFPTISIIIQKFFDSSRKMSILIMLLSTVIAIYMLMLIIYKGEYVYWINGGPSYEEAKSAGSQKRKQYAKAHLELFFKMTLVCFLYGLISIIFKFPQFIDISLISLAIIITALLTIPIKFDK